MKVDFVVKFKLIYISLIPICQIVPLYSAEFLHA